MNDRSRPTVLLLATTWWPLSARLAMALMRDGWHVAALCPPGHPLAWVQGIELFAYRQLAPSAALERAVESCSPQLLVPCDDRAVWHLHTLAERPALAALIRASLGDRRFYASLRSRAACLEVAARAGVAVPETVEVESREQIEAWFASGRGRGVLKRDGSWGGNGVIVAESPAQALAACEVLRRPLSLPQAPKRALVNRDPLALWAWRQGEPAAVTLQSFLPGRPANTMFVADGGHMLAALSVEVLCSRGETGAATVVREIRSPHMEAAARRIAAAWGLTGFFGLDFILAAPDDRPVLIEINPRCTQLGHLPMEDGRDLAGILSARLLGPRSHAGAVDEPAGEAETEVPAAARSVAFYPTGLEALAQFPELGDARLDEPSGQPELARELLREPWPERRLAARLYHALRPSRAAANVLHAGRSEGGREYAPSRPVELLPSALEQQRA